MAVPGERQYLFSFAPHSPQGSVHFTHKGREALERLGLSYLTQLVCLLISSIGASLWFPSQGSLSWAQDQWCGML